MRRLDTHNAIQFVDIAADDSVCPIDRRALLERFTAREEDGPLLSGAAAFAAMWRAIPMLRFAGLAARNPALLTGLEWLYLRFLRFRPRSSALLASRRAG